MIDLFQQHQAELIWTFHLVTTAFLVHNLTGELLVALNQINWTVSGLTFSIYVLIVIIGLYLKNFRFSIWNMQ